MEFIQFKNTKDIPVDGVSYFNRALGIIGVEDKLAKDILSTTDAVLLTDHPPCSFSPMVETYEETAPIKLWVNANGNVSIYSDDPSYQAYLSKWYLPSLSLATVANTAILLRHCKVNVDKKISTILAENDEVKISNLETARAKDYKSKKSFMSLVESGMAVSSKHEKGDREEWTQKILSSLASKELNLDKIKSTDQWRISQGEEQFPEIIEGTIDGVYNLKKGKSGSSQLIVQTIAGSTVKIISFTGFSATELAVFNKKSFIRIGLHSPIDLNKGVVEYHGLYTVLPMGINVKPTSFRSPTRRIPTTIYSSMVWETILLEELKNKMK